MLVHKKRFVDTTNSDNLALRRERRLKWKTAYSESEIRLQEILEDIIKTARKEQKRLKSV